MNKITSCKAKEIKDSRGNPTIEVEIGSEDVFMSASVPSGASAGSREALEKRDEDGKGVQTAIKNVNEIIGPAIMGLDVEPLNIDELLLELDGTENKSNLGANAILGVSIATTKLKAKLENKPLWQYINEMGSEVIDNLRAFLYQTARNTVIDFYRSRDQKEFVALPPMKRGHATGFQRLVQHQRAHGRLLEANALALELRQGFDARLGQQHVGAHRNVEHQHRHQRQPLFAGAQHFVERQRRAVGLPRG